MNAYGDMGLRQSERDDKDRVWRGPGSGRAVGSWAEAHDTVCSSFNYLGCVKQCSWTKGASFALCRPQLRELGAPITARPLLNAGQRSGVPKSSLGSEKT